MTSPNSEPANRREGRRRTTPDVSVIVPVHNAEEYLPLCLDSVLMHGDVALEIICVNDGSSDSSLAILQRYAKAFDCITVIDQQNAGLSGARNAGLAAATGTYVCFLDSDDWWEPVDVAGLIRTAREQELDVLAYDAESFRDAGVSADQWDVYATYYQRSREYADPVTGARLLTEFRKNDDYRVSACLYFVRLDLIRGMGLDFSLGMMHEDNPFTFQVLLYAQRAAHTRVRLYGRRVRPGSMMTAGSIERSTSGYVRSYLLMLDALGRWSGDDPEVSEHVGRVVYQALVNARSQHKKLSGADPLAAITGLELEPRAYTAALLMARLR